MLRLDRRCNNGNRLGCRLCLPYTRGSFGARTRSRSHSRPVLVSFWVRFTLYAFDDGFNPGRQNSDAFSREPMVVAVLDVSLTVDTFFHFTFLLLWLVKPAVLVYFYSSPAICASVFSAFFPPVFINIRRIILSMIMLSLKFAARVIFRTRRSNSLLLTGLLE